MGMTKYHVFLMSSIVSVFIFAACSSVEDQIGNLQPLGKTLFGYPTSYVGSFPGLDNRIIRIIYPQPSEYLSVGFATASPDLPPDAIVSSLREVIYVHLHLKALSDVASDDPGAHFLNRANYQLMIDGRLAADRLGYISRLLAPAPITTTPGKIASSGSWGGSLSYLINTEGLDAGWHNAELILRLLDGSQDKLSWRFEIVESTLTVTP